MSVTDIINSSTKYAEESRLNLCSMNASRLLPVVIKTGFVALGTGLLLGTTVGVISGTVALMIFGHPSTWDIAKFIDCIVGSINQNQQARQNTIHHPSNQIYQTQQQQATRQSQAPIAVAFVPSSQTRETTLDLNQAIALLTPILGICFISDLSDKKVVKGIVDDINDYFRTLRKSEPKLADQLENALAVIRKNIDNEFVPKKIKKIVKKINTGESLLGKIKRTVKNAVN